jgi:hypothetical protein
MRLLGLALAAAAAFTGTSPAADTPAEMEKSLQAKDWANADDRGTFTRIIFGAGPGRTVLVQVETNDNFFGKRVHFGYCWKGSYTVTRVAGGEAAIECRPTDKYLYIEDQKPSRESGFPARTVTFIATSAEPPVAGTRTFFFGGDLSELHSWKAGREHRLDLFAVTRHP